MGTFHQYSCNLCNTRFELGGPQEFKNTLLGKVKTRHASMGMKKHINGLWLYLWCNQCKRVEKRIMVEFERKCMGIEVWGRTAPIKARYMKEFKGQFNCPKCNAYLQDQIKEATACPTCKTGKLEYHQSIQT